MQKIKQDIHIGSNLRRLRMAKGLTQDKVVTSMQLSGCRITRSIYSRYETGELNIPASHLITLRKVFECNYDDFFMYLDDYNR